MTITLPNGPVMLVEDDAMLRAATMQALELAGFEVQPFDDAARASRHLMPSFAGCVVSDIRMAGMDGLQLFERARAVDPDIPVILITGHGDIGMAVRALHEGAFDFIAKPFATDHLAASIRRALQARHLVLDNRRLRQALATPQTGLIGSSRAMMHLRAMLAQLAAINLDVLIEGEAGTGKEVCARALHQQSPRAAAPFVVLPCATLAGTAVIEDAMRQARGGTLYLDGIDDLDAASQTLLVALLDARDRVQSAAAEQARVVAATATPLRLMADNGHVLGQLHYRLSAVTLQLPPLRERRDDIAPLFAHFVRDALDQTRKKRFDMSAADRKRLLEYDWPGNVRELKSYALAAVLNLPRHAMPPTGNAGQRNLATRVKAYERMLIIEALEATGGNIIRTSAILGTPRKTLYEKLAKLDIDPQGFRRPGKSRKPG